MMDSGKHNDLRWGNRLGYIMLPFEIAMHDDPLDYVRNAKKTVDRKKHSLEAIVTRVVTETVTKLLGIEVIIRCTSIQLLISLFHEQSKYVFAMLHRLILGTGPVDPNFNASG